MKTNLIYVALLVSSLSWATSPALRQDLQERRDSEREKIAELANRRDMALQEVRQLTDMIALKERQIAEQTEQLRQLDERRHALEDRLRQLRISPASVDEVRRDLEKQYTNLEIDLVGLAAEKKAILEFVEQQRAQGAAVGRQVIEHLARILNNKEKMLDRLRALNAQGAVTEADVVAAEGDIEEAKIRLLQAEQSLAQASNDQAIQLQLLQNTTATASARARLASINNKLQSFEALRSDISRLKQIEGYEVDKLNSRLARSETELMELKEQSLRQEHWLAHTNALLANLRDQEKKQKKEDDKQQDK